MRFSATLRHYAGAIDAAAFTGRQAVDPFLTTSMALGLP
jgi:hypothetical protein